MLFVAKINHNINIYCTITTELVVDDKIKSLVEMSVSQIARVRRVKIVDIIEFHSVRHSNTRNIHNPSNKIIYIDRVMRLVERKLEY